MEREQRSLVLPVDPLNPSVEAIERAAQVLRQGGVLAYPTETVYGLGVDPFREEALERLFHLKGRPREMPVSVLVRDEGMMREVAREIPPRALALIKAFLPGPLTLVLPAQPGLPARLTAGTGKIGVRISHHPLVENLFRLYSFPVTTTSANPSGRAAARTGAEVAAYFPVGLDCILDAGPVPGGVGSTVVDVTGDRPEILREGVLSREEIGRVISL